MYASKLNLLILIPFTKLCCFVYKQKATHNHSTIKNYFSWQLKMFGKEIITI